MSLLRLPPETLASVLDLVGSSFFHQDLGRLTICKNWYDFALPASLKHISIDQRKLRTFITSGATSNLQAFGHRLQSLDLQLEGIEGCDFTTSPAHTANSQAHTDPSLERGVLNLETQTGSEDLKNDLLQLTKITQRFPNMRTLRIRARNSPPSEPLQTSSAYLLPSTIKTLLSTANLRILVLDLTAGFLEPSEGHGVANHICPSIAALLNTLHTVHVRMRSICPELLKPPNHSHSLHLREVVVNLSLTAGITSMAHSRRCGPEGPGMMELKSALQKEAEILTARMAAPKTVRILTHSIPQFETHSFDVVTGRTMVLAEGAAWDDDGEMVEEESLGSESELQDDEFDTYLDED